MVRHEINKLPIVRILDLTFWLALLWLVRVARETCYRTDTSGHAVPVHGFFGEETEVSLADAPSRAC